MTHGAAFIAAQHIDRLAGMLYSLYSLLLVASGLHAYALVSPIRGALWMPLDSAWSLMCVVPNKKRSESDYARTKYSPNLFRCSVVSGQNLFRFSVSPNPLIERTRSIWLKKTKHLDEDNIAFVGKPRSLRGKDEACC